MKILLSKVIIERLKKLKKYIWMRLQNLPSLSGNLIRIGFKFWQTSGGTSSAARLTLVVSASSYSKMLVEAGSATNHESTVQQKIVVETVSVTTHGML